MLKDMGYKLSPAFRPVSHGKTQTETLSLATPDTKQTPAHQFSLLTGTIRPAERNGMSSKGPTTGQKQVGRDSEVRFGFIFIAMNDT